MAVIVLAFGGLIFVLTQMGRPEAPEEETAGATGQEQAGQANETETRAEGQTFEGSGATTERFTAAGGLAIIKLSHRGPSNFVVLYGQGQASQLLVNEVGRYDGSRALNLAPGDYTLQIDATGDWTVGIEQTTPTAADPPPQNLSGSGQAATKFFSLRAGPANFRVHHGGTGFFAPALLRADGTLVTNLANELGEFTGDKRVDIPAEGIYLIDVSANGDWTIDVSQ